MRPPLERAYDSLDALASEYELEIELVQRIRRILVSLHAQTIKSKK